MKKYTLVGLGSLIIGVALLFFAYTYYTYSQANALRACAEYGAGLDEKLKKRAQPTQYIESFLTRYQSKNGTCYQDVTISYSDTEMKMSSIKNAYTNEVLSGCTFYEDKGIFVSDVHKPFCNRYFQDANNIFGDGYTQLR